MTQPTFAFPCEYGLEVQRTSYGAVAKFATSSGSAVPSGTGQQTSVYEIKTVPIDNDVAVSLDSQLTALRGSFFLSQFYFDDQPYKYRIVNDTWNWQVIGPTANIFTLNVERLQDATVEFPLDYGQTLENGVGSHFFRIATTSGTATPSTTVYQQRRYSVATRTLSKQSAQSLETTLRGLGGSAFYSQVYLDSNPRLYKLEENSWQFETQGENAYKATFSLLEVYSSTGGDYPCAIEAATLSRTSYGERIKLAAASGNAVPGTSSIVINSYDIKTLELTDAAASNLETSLANLSGSYFFGKFYYDAVVKKYRVVNDTWQRIVNGKDANTIVFAIEEVYEPTVEFAIDYGATLSSVVTTHFFRIATSSGTAVPTATILQQRLYPVTTRAMSKTAASSLASTLETLGGGAFYSKVHLDAVPRRYKLEGSSWSFTPEGEDAYKASFTLAEVYDINDGDIPCSLDRQTLERQSYAARIKISANSGGAVPSTAPIVLNKYSIATAKLNNTVANSLETSLTNLVGSFFFGKFFYDATVKKYRVVEDQWSREVVANDENTIAFAIEEVYEPTVEFAIDYGLTQAQTVSSNLIRIATASGTATPSATSRAMKNMQVRTRAMSRTAAASLDTTLLGLNGGSFYSQMYLDAVPKLYRLSPYQWQWTPEGEDAYACQFDVVEVMTSTTDIPCREEMGIERRSRIRKVQFGDGYEQLAPDGINTETVTYAIETLPLSDTQAASLNTTLLSRKGDFFFSKLPDETVVAKYRLDDNRWSWSIQGKDANVFQFRLRKVYDL